MPRILSPATKPGRQLKSNRFVATNGTPPILQEEIITVSGIDQMLVDIGKRYLHDPLSFVQDMFLWDSGRLRGQHGPLEWQEEVLADIGYGLEEHPDIFRLAVASGKGAGKTALVAQLFIWHVTTRLHSQTTLTAVTGSQIDRRSWNEVKKWIRQSKLYEWFMIQSTKLVHRSIDTWYGAHQTWSEERPEAFQGSHEEYVCFLVDEASGVPDTILETIESGLTDQHVFLGYFSNPTRSIGRFRHCFLGGNNAHLWETYNIDTREVEITNKERISEILEEYGGDVEASQFRINVRGQFALEDYDQVIPEWIVKAAQERNEEPMVDDPIVIGADIAAKGLNKTVFIARQGCKILDKRVYAKQEIDQTVDRLGDFIHLFENPITFIDADGYGQGVYDLCKRLRYKVEQVHSGLPATVSDRYCNKRAEMWYDCREWLRTFGCLNPQDKSLANQLMCVTFGHDIQGRIKLETKEEMRNRGYASPDEADALVYTFARRIPKGKVAFIDPTPRIPVGLGWLYR